MQLYLVQHAKAVPKEQDPQRPLSEEGRKEATRVADFIRPLALSVDQLWHSGRLRAVQTAEIYASVVRLGEGPATHGGLAPKDNAAPLRDELAVATDETMIVGHMPFVSRLASLLLTSYETPPIVSFMNAGIVCLERTPDNAWQVRWAITPEMLPE
jgi:phosphohistidine phosphatase